MTVEDLIERLRFRGRYDGETAHQAAVRRYEASEEAATTLRSLKDEVEDLRCLLREVIEHASIVPCECGEQQCLTNRIRSTLDKGRGV